MYSSLFRWYNYILETNKKVYTIVLINVLTSLQNDNFTLTKEEDTHLILLIINIFSGVYRKKNAMGDLSFRSEANQAISFLE